MGGKDARRARLLEAWKLEAMLLPIASGKERVRM
jgi:hypothetical protein